VQVISIQPELVLSRAKLRRDENRLDEFDDIVDLLTDHQCDNSEETRSLILFIADACMGENHLWQDMGLANREVLSNLMQRYFPQLFANNTGNMKWKKFFYKQLCERAEIIICKSPTCGVCVDYPVCFGAEDA
jgi:nitrogen fixation protein NifQ